MAATVVGVLVTRQQRHLSAIIAMIGATALLLVHGPAYFDFYADDALITLRYSEHLADGIGPNWNSSRATPSRTGNTASGSGQLRCCCVLNSAPKIRSVVQATASDSVAQEAEQHFLKRPEGSP